MIKVDKELRDTKGIIFRLLCFLKVCLARGSLHPIKAWMLK